MDRPRVSAGWAVAKFVVLGIVAASTSAAWAAAERSDPLRDADPDIRATVAALTVARHAASLAGTASVRTRSDMSSEAMAASSASIVADAAEARRQLDLLAAAGREEAAARVRELLDELTLNAQQLEDGRPRIAQILRDSQNSRQELIAATSWQLLPAALASEDDLFYRMVSSRGAAATVSIEDLLLYARLALLTQQVDQGYIALEVATRQTDSEFIGTVEEAANLVIYQLRENIESLADADHADLDPTLVPLARDLVDAAYGEANLIDLMKTRLRLDEREAQLAGVVNAAWFSLQTEVDAVLDQAIEDLEGTTANRETARALRATLAVSRHGSAARSYWSRPTTASTPVAGMTEIRDTVAAHVSAMRQALATLRDAGYGAAIAHLSPEIDRLEYAAGRIHDGRADLVGALQSADRERAELRSFVDYQLEPAVVASLDNQLYYMLTGRSEFREDVPADSDPLSHLELMRYRHLSSVYNSLFRTFSGLIIAIIMAEETLIGEGEERFGTASHRLERSIDFLEEQGGPELDPRLVSLARQFIGFGNGESNVFDSLRHRLPLIASEMGLIEVSRQVHSRLQTDMDALLDDMLQAAVSPPGASGGAP